MLLVLQIHGVGRTTLDVLEGASVLGDDRLIASTRVGGDGGALELRRIRERV